MVKTKQPIPMLRGKEQIVQIITFNVNGISPAIWGLSNYGRLHSFLPLTGEWQLRSEGLDG